MEQYIVVNFFILCIFSLIFILITLLVGGKIMGRYFSTNSNVFLIIGVAWIGLSFPWLPEALKLFFISFQADLSENTVILLYLGVNIMAAPAFLILWIIGVNKLLPIKKSQKRGLLIGTLLLSITFEFLIVILLSLDKDFIVSKYIPELYSVNWSLFIIAFQVILVIIVLFTGILFARVPLCSENQEVKLKGIFLLVAFISFVVGAVLEVFFTVRTTPGLISKIICRIILMSSSVEFYIGFIFPEKVKKFFLH